MRSREIEVNRKIINRRRQDSITIVDLFLVVANCLPPLSGEFEIQRKGSIAMPYSCKTTVVNRSTKNRSALGNSRRFVSATGKPHPTYDDISGPISFRRLSTFL